MAHVPFVPLRVLSSYSMLEGAIEPAAIATMAKERGFPAVAICDRNGLYGSVAFAKACFETGIQPIVGTLLGVARGDDFGGEAGIDYLPLFVQDEAGWNNLCHLVSRAHLERPVELAPHVSLADLEGRSGCMSKSRAVAMRSSRQRNRDCSTSPILATCRWSRPIRQISPIRISTARTTPCCASPVVARCSRGTGPGPIPTPSFARTR